MATKGPVKARKAAPKRAPAPKSAPTVVETAAVDAAVETPAEAEAPLFEPARPPVAVERDSRVGAFRESVLEHAFLAELLKEAWRRQVVVDVLRPEVEAGSDVVLAGGGVLRYVQLRTSRAEAKTGKQKIAVGLRETPNACVVWIVADAAFGLTYRYLDVSGLDWDSLPVADRTKGDDDSTRHERLGHRVVTRGQFKAVPDIGKLFELLFAAK